MEVSNKRRKPAPPSNTGPKKNQHRRSETGAHHNAANVPPPNAPAFVPQPPLRDSRGMVLVEHCKELLSRIPHLIRLSDDPAYNLKYVVLLQEKDLSVGKTKACDIKLFGWDISKTQHCVFHNTAGSITIQRAEGQVYRNGKAIADVEKLQHNDRIVLGLNNPFIFVDPIALQQQDGKMGVATTAYTTAVNEVHEHNQMMLSPPPETNRVASKLGATAQAAATVEAAKKTLTEHFEQKLADQKKQLEKRHKRDLSNQRHELEEKAQAKLHQELDLMEEKWKAKLKNAVAEQQPKEATVGGQDNHESEAAGATQSSDGEVASTGLPSSNVGGSGAGGGGDLAHANSLRLEARKISFCLCKQVGFDLKVKGLQDEGGGGSFNTTTDGMGLLDRTLSATNMNASFFGNYGNLLQSDGTGPYLVVVVRHLLISSLVVELDLHTFETYVLQMRQVFDAVRQAVERGDKTLEIAPDDDPWNKMFAHEQLIGTASMLASFITLGNAPPLQVISTSGRNVGCLRASFTPCNVNGDPDPDNAVVQAVKSRDIQDGIGERFDSIVHLIKLEEVSEQHSRRFNNFFVRYSLGDGAEVTTDSAQCSDGSGERQIEFQHKKHHTVENVDAPFMELLSQDADGTIDFRFYGRDTTRVDTGALKTSNRLIQDSLAAHTNQTLNTDDRLALQAELVSSLKAERDKLRRQVMDLEKALYKAQNGSLTSRRNSLLNGAFGPSTPSRAPALSPPLTSKLRERHAPSLSQHNRSSPLPHPAFSSQSSPSSPHHRSPFSEHRNPVAPLPTKEKHSNVNQTAPNHQQPKHVTSADSSAFKPIVSLPPNSNLTTQATSALCNTTNTNPSITQNNALNTNPKQLLPPTPFPPPNSLPSPNSNVSIAATLTGSMSSMATSATESEADMLLCSVND